MCVLSTSGYCSNIWSEKLFEKKIQKEVDTADNRGMVRTMKRMNDDKGFQGSALTSLVAHAAQPFAVARGPQRLETGTPLNIQGDPGSYCRW
jgi:hypothetical protein